MVLCWASGCKHYNNRETCRFFTFPKDEKLRKVWLSLLRRSDNPGKGACVCSCHFREGKKENLPKIFDFDKENKCGYTDMSLEKQKGVKRKLVEDYDSLPSTSTQSQSPDKTVLVELSENLPSTSTSTRPDIQIPDKTVLVDLYENLPSTSTQPDIHIADKTADVELHENVPSTSTLPRPDIQIQEKSDSTGLSKDVLEAENYLLKLENERLLEKISEGDKFCYDKISSNDTFIRLYTGLPTKKIFDSLYELLKNVEINYIYGSRVNKIPKIDQLLMTLMKLRQNFPHADLACRFKVSESTVSNIVITWMHVLYEILYVQLMDHIPSRNKNKSCLPNCFSTFTNCRIILDCTEISVAVDRTSLLNQKKTYSTYKHKNTFKGLIGTAPNGVITFVSDLYAGSTSDKMIVSDSGVLDKLEPGDLVLADKGFLIGDILPPDVHLNIPPFLSTSQFTVAQIQQTQTIARACIHVERAIGRMKMYKILDFIPHTLSKYTNMIFKVIAAITNLHYPLIKETENQY